MRMIEIILTDLANDKIQAEEELQRLINNDKVDVKSQVNLIKVTLKDIVEIDNMIAKWRSYTVQQETPNNN